MSWVEERRTRCAFRMARIATGMVTAGGFFGFWNRGRYFPACRGRRASSTNDRRIINREGGRRREEEAWGSSGGGSDRHRSWSHTGRGRSCFPEPPPSDNDMGLFFLFDPDREDLDMEISSHSNLHCGCISTATVRARDGSGLGPGETGRIRIPSPSAAGQELREKQGKGQDTDTASPTGRRRNRETPSDGGDIAPPPSPPLDAVDMRLRFRAPHLSLPLTRSGRPPPPPVPFLNGPPVRVHHGMTMAKWGRFGYARHPRQGVDVIHGCTGEVGAPVPVEARVVVQGGNTGQTVCRAVVASGKGGALLNPDRPHCLLTHTQGPSVSSRLLGPLQV